MSRANCYGVGIWYKTGGKGVNRSKEPQVNTKRFQGTINQLVVYSVLESKEGQL